ncbi:hypothetical protein GGE07_002885 [Sinorhizobium terangae]|nr:hypothetical protein [Sinorhizobium terangae]
MNFKFRDLIGQPNDGSESGVVLWVFQDYDRHWRVRKEGERSDVAHPSRREAVVFARELCAGHRSYKIYLQLADGRFALELLNTGGGASKTCC